MAGNLALGVGSGRVTSGIELDTLPLRTIGFVCQQLPAWRDDPHRPPEQAEDKLNSQLCKFLDSRARHDFPMVRFDHEEYQFDRRRVDMAASPAKAIVIGAMVYTIYDPILVLEGKRLPAPSADREKEYVTGYQRKSGGIQRFKLGLHGAELDVAAMIGYVQERSPREWHVTISQWISELVDGKDIDNCVWKADEKLGPLEDNVAEQLARSLSIHNRTGSALSEKIAIHHLWISMTPE